MEPAFEFRDAGLECFLGDATRLLEQPVDGGAGKFRDAADSVREADLSKAFVLLFSEAEADHSTFGFDVRHSFKDRFCWAR